MILKSKELFTLLSLSLLLYSKQNAAAESTSDSEEDSQEDIEFDNRLVHLPTNPFKGNVSNKFEEAELVMCNNEPYVFKSVRYMKEMGEDIPSDFMEKIKEGRKVHKKRCKGKQKAKRIDLGKKKITEKVEESLDDNEDLSDGSNIRRLEETKKSLRKKKDNVGDVKEEKRKSLEKVEEKGYSDRIRKEDSQIKKTCGLFLWVSGRANHFPSFSKQRPFTLSWYEQRALIEKEGKYDFVVLVAPSSNRGNFEGDALLGLREFAIDVAKQFLPTVENLLLKEDSKKPHLANVCEKWDLYLQGNCYGGTGIRTLLTVSSHIWSENLEAYKKYVLPIQKIIADSTKFNLKTVLLTVSPANGIKWHKKGAYGIEKGGILASIVKFIPKVVYRKIFKASDIRELYIFDKRKLLCQLAQQEKRDLIFHGLTNGDKKKSATSDEDTSTDEYENDLLRQNKGSLILAFENTAYYFSLENDKVSSFRNASALYESSISSSKAANKLRAREDLHWFPFLIDASKSKLNKSLASAFQKRAKERQENRRNFKKKRRDSEGDDEDLTHEEKELKRMYEMVNDQEFCSRQKKKTDVFSYTAKFHEFINFEQKPRPFKPQRYVAYVDDVRDGKITCTSHWSFSGTRTFTWCLSRNILKHVATRQLQSPEDFQKPLGIDHLPELVDHWYD